MKRLLCAALAAALVLPLFAFAGCGGKEAPRDLYQIDAEYRDGVLAAEMRFTFYNDTGESLGTLEFNLFGNAYREDSVYSPVSPSLTAAAYYAGESYGSMTVSDVSPCKSWEVCGADENILRVELAESVSAGERAEITVSYTLTLAKVSHRTGITEHAVNLGNFYPILCVYEDGAFYECEYYSDGDPFYSECADYAVTLRTDGEYTVASSGRILSAERDGRDTVYEMELSGARDFALVLGKEFSVAQGESGGVQVMYYYYDDDSPQERLELIEDCLGYFSETFGDYAYPTYSAVQTGFCVGGMEYPALTMIGDRLAGADRDYVIVHETAHQWWYAAVGNNQLEDAWLDEGLAEYSAALYYETRPGYGVTMESRVRAAENAYKALYGVHEQIFGAADTSMDKKLGEYLSEYSYVVIAYDKGFLLFDTLRSAAGDKKFFAGLKRYYEEKSGKIASQEDLAGSFRRAGLRAEGVIASFVDGTAVI